MKPVISIIEIHLEFVDKNPERRSRNGGPLASARASQARENAAEAAQAAIETLGFVVHRVGSGVIARDFT